MSKAKMKNVSPANPLDPFRTAVPFLGLPTWNSSHICICSICMCVYLQQKCSTEGVCNLIRLGPQSRCGDNLLGVRVRYMFIYSRAALKRVKNCTYFSARNFLDSVWHFFFFAGIKG